MNGYLSYDRWVMKMDLGTVANKVAGDRCRLSNQRLVRVRQRFLRRVARQRLGITPDEIDGGHTPALSHPHELVDRLEAYAAEQGLLGGH